MTISVCLINRLDVKSTFDEIVDLGTYPTASGETVIRVVIARCLICPRNDISPRACESYSSEGIMR